MFWKLLIWSRTRKLWHITNLDSRSSNPMFSSLNFISFLLPFWNCGLFAPCHFLQEWLEASHRSLWTWRKQAQKHWTYTGVYSAVYTGVYMGLYTRHTWYMLHCTLSCMLECAQDCTSDVHWRGPWAVYCTECWDVHLYCTEDVHQMWPCCCKVASVVSDSVWPQRRQPLRLCHPWDSPSKNTGVGCHFLLQCMKVKVKSLSRVRLLATPWTAAYQAPPSMGFSSQVDWTGVPLPSPRCGPVVSRCIPDVHLSVPDVHLTVPNVFHACYRFV